MTTEVPMKTVANCATGEVVIVPMTAAEIEQAQKDAAQHLAREAEREAQALALAEAKASALAKLEALGLTEEEAKAIVG